MPVLYSTRPRPDRHRWLISYADFVTLLLAVFVVLFAAGRHGQDTARLVSKAISAALKPRAVARVTVPLWLRSTAVPDSRPGQAPPNPLSPSCEALASRLRPEIESRQVALRLEPRGIVVSLLQTVLFPPGKAVINRSVYPVMDKLAGVVAGLPNQVRLEGHTDNVPVRNSRFRNNWELSSARSIAMLELLVNRYRIPRDRVSIAAFAANFPLGSNGRREGRARNRRVDLVILNPEATADPQRAPYSLH